MKEKININFDKYITNIPEHKRDKLFKYKSENHNELKALIPGTIIKINVKEGDRVKKGDLLLILEAMKMRNRIYAKEDGIIKKINVRENYRVVKDEVMIIFDK